MAGRHQMRALGRKSGDDGADDMAFAEADGQDGAFDAMLDLSETWAEDDEVAVSPARSGWLAPSLAVLVIAGWSGFFVSAHLADIRGGALPAQWAGWIVEWAVPVALVGIVWLLAMRSSHAEGRRFAATAALMNREGAALEARLKFVNRELSLAREFLAAEARDLEALGRIAAERLSTHAGELQALITTNGAQVEAIGTTSETALGNMNRLRDDLPVIANAARDVANQIGGAGRVAEDQLARLTGGFDRLGFAGAESEAQVTRLTAQVGDTLGQYEAQLTRIEAIVTKRFAALQTEAEAYRTRIAALEEEALAAHGERAQAIASQSEALANRLREAGETARASYAAAIAALHETLVEKLNLVDQLDRNSATVANERIAKLREEAVQFDEQLATRNRQFDELIEQRQAAFETHEAQASEVLAQRLAALDDALAQRREAQVAEIEKLVVQGEAMTERVAELGRVLAEIDQTSVAARESLGAGLDTLAQQLGEKRAVISATEAHLMQLTDSSVRLLEILQSGARTCREDLNTAINGANIALEGVEARADKVEALMLRSTQAGSDLSDYLLRTRAEIETAETAIAGFKSHLAEETEDALARLQGLRGGFARLAEESGTLAVETQDSLRASLSALETAITRAFATLDEGAREKMLALANNLGGEAVEVLERALRNEAAATLGKLEQSAAHASGVGREAAIQLRDQLVKVNELTGNLEQRVMHARELAEEQVNNDFARRMALITDSLNSAAIDITGALADEVADTAWEAYLKGDRGIFTRRAVRLIDNGTAKDIAALYSADDTFKANVSRYIHDFEAMLRQTLSTRDGHVLSVTMLGSDMGKLYVALAQAIQRFRT
ncbi:ATPase [Porphyrobacter sp. SLTP]|uniref:ATPase n=1 Tax=Porphyrobacter sp. SLTP TaxID=2683266 RepID=UPI001412906F|nr:ATPase [Porphyrobacter sp. SLTP]NBB25360.1 ATPase [Porphyrobacter sp. SLTP]